MPASRRVLGIVGAAVAVAAAGMIVLLVATPSDHEPERVESVRPAFALPEIPKTLPTPPKPSKVAPVVEPKVEPKVAQPKIAPSKPADKPKVAFLTDRNKQLIESILDKQLSGKLSNFRGMDPSIGFGAGKGTGVGTGIGTGTGTGTGTVRSGTGRGPRVAPPSPDSTTPPAPRPEP